MPIALTGGTSGGGSGTVSDVESTDSSVGVTNGTGPTVDLSASFGNLADVDTSGLGDGDVPIYDSGTSKWNVGSLTATGFEPRTGFYQTMPGPTATSPMGVGYIVAVPFSSPIAFTATKIGLNITGAGSAGSTVRLGIYNDDGAGHPGTLLLNAGTIDGTSATFQEITISQALKAGTVYWLALIVTTASCVSQTSANSSLGLFACMASTSAYLAANGAIQGLLSTSGQTTLADPFPWTSGGELVSNQAPRILIGS
jgi:hypothetical protein